MSKATLIKPVGAGFAYSDHELVIKLSIRPAREGWYFEVRTGTRGGTLADETPVTVENEAAAISMLENRIAREVLNGYRRAA